MNQDLGDWPNQMENAEFSASFVHDLYFELLHFKFNVKLFIYICLKEINIRLF